MTKKSDKKQSDQDAELAQQRKSWRKERKSLKREIAERLENGDDYDDMLPSRAAYRFRFGED